MISFGVWLASTLEFASDYSQAHLFAPSRVARMTRLDPRQILKVTMFPCISPTRIPEINESGETSRICSKATAEHRGLFDEISIKRLGETESEPFQVQVKKSGGGLKGPWRNLIDVGYGVSQALPVITELLREDAPDIFLLQQPEVHLHPVAQAALGSLFCQVAGPDHQLIVETHSDHLLDRVRMEVRDSQGSLTASDVSILFFERSDLNVLIHSLRVDEEGNILGAPDSYRQFFMEETTRSLGL